MEPDNPYDKNAVHITDIRGASLGFVPRDLTYNICYPVSFGFIYSMGRVTSVLSEPLGATVCVEIQCNLGYSYTTYIIIITLF